MSYWRFVNVITTMMLIAIFTVPDYIADYVAFGSGMVCLGLGIGRWFGIREERSR